MVQDIQDKDINRLRAWLGSGSINLFGIPFSGKDTQGKRLAEIFNANLISGGDIIRHNHEAQEVNRIIDQGHLAPQDAYLKMVLPYLSMPQFDSKPLILSSVGRWHGEEKPVLLAAAQANHPIKAVIELVVPQQAAYERWETAQQRKDRGNRNDDRKETIAIRLDEYTNKTKPVIDFYKQKNLLIQIDGTQTESEVKYEIVQKLLKKASNEQA